MVKSVWELLFVSLLLCNLFGCANPETRQTQELVTTADSIPDSNLKIKYQELKVKGMAVIKRRPDFEKSRKAIIMPYNVKFLQEIADCDTLSLGLQFILIEHVEHELGESLLAVSACNLKEFSEMLAWYQSNIDDAKEFLQIAKSEPNFSQIIEENNLKMFDEFLQKNGFILCDPENTMDVLREYQEHLSI